MARFVSDPEALRRLQRWLVAEHGFVPRRDDLQGRLSRLIGDDWSLVLEIEGRVFLDHSYDAKGSVPRFYLTPIDVEQVLAEVQGRSWDPLTGLEVSRSHRVFGLRDLVSSRRNQWITGEGLEDRWNYVEFDTMQAETLEGIAAVEAMCDLDDWIEKLHDDYGWAWTLPPGRGWTRLVQHAMAGEAEFAATYKQIDKVRPDPQAWENLQAWMTANPDGVEPHASANRRLREQGRILAPGELDLDACRLQDVVQRIGDAGDRFGEVLAVNADIDVTIVDAPTFGFATTPAPTHLNVQITVLTAAPDGDSADPDGQRSPWDNVTVHIAPPAIRNQGEREAAGVNYRYTDTQRQLIDAAKTKTKAFASTRLNSATTPDGTPLAPTESITITNIETWETGR